MIDVNFHCLGVLQGAVKMARNTSDQSNKVSQCENQLVLDILGHIEEFRPVQQVPEPSRAAVKEPEEVLKCGCILLSELCTNVNNP